MKTETIQEELCIEVCQTPLGVRRGGGWGEVGGLWLSILGTSPASGRSKGPIKISERIPPCCSNSFLVWGVWGPLVVSLLAKMLLKP